MILADTTIWIDHFRVQDPTLLRLAATAQLLMHPFVLGELVMGSLSSRTERIRYWSKLPGLPAQSHEHLRLLVENKRLYSRGIGYTDVNLLASTLFRPGTHLWTRDKRLASIADELGVAAKLDH